VPFSEITRQNGGNILPPGPALHSDNYLCAAVMSLPVVDNHLLDGVNELTRRAFPRQTLILAFNQLETAIFHTAGLQSQLSVHLVHSSYKHPTGWAKKVGPQTHDHNSVKS